jgi:ribosome-associated protein
VTASPLSVELATEAAHAAADKLAVDIVAFDVADQLGIADVFLLCSGNSDRQVRAIVDAIEERLRDRTGRPVRREGEREARWVLLDYIDLVVHVMQAEDRAYYALERLWKDCPTVPVAPPAPVGGDSRS